MKKTTNKLVTPDIMRRLQQLRIVKRRAFLGMRAGGHISLRRGAGLEFSDYSVYVPGDDFRRIDWGVFGRTERLYVRRFHEEQDINVSVLLDSSASMHLDARKYEVCEGLGLALSLVALAGGDNVAMNVLGTGKRIRVNGLRGFRELQQGLEAIDSKLSSDEGKGEVEFVKEIERALATEKHPGKCFLISDFLFEPEKCFQALSRLARKGFEVAVIQVLSPEECELKEQGALMLKDAETGEMVKGVFDSESIKEYGLKLEKHISEIQRICKKFSASYLFLRTDREFEEIVTRDFSRAGFIGQ